MVPNESLAPRWTHRSRQQCSPSEERHRTRSSPISRRESIWPRSTSCDQPTAIHSHLSSGSNSAEGCDVIGSAINLHRLQSKGFQGRTSRSEASVHATVETSHKQAAPLNAISSRKVEQLHW